MNDTEEAKTTIRMPRDLLERLRKQAQRNRRTINQQVLVYVEDGLEVDEGGDHS